MKKLFLLAACSLWLAGFSQNAPVTSADIYLNLKKLNVLGSVLYIAAHPDDENTRLLAYFSKEKLYRTGYLSLTRGDGGQNLIGDEQGVELGLIRTQELLAARRIDGAEQFFTRAFDFGFSKNPEETFQHWDKEKILNDVVWVIRKFQPDVIITRFPTTGEGGHGHHTASAILANEAFTAAADPKRFPEQLKFVQPWQAKRILWNTFNFGSTNTTREDQFHFDVGGYNAIIGKSYGEIAAESRSQHKSQGFGVPASRGEAIEYFKATGGNTPSNDLFDDVSASWQRVGGSAIISKMITDIIASFDFTQPQKSVPQLIQLMYELNGMPQSYWRDQKLKETKNLIEQTSGLFMEAFTNDQFAVQGDSIKINYVVNDRIGVDAKLVSINTNTFDTSFNASLRRNSNKVFSKTFYVEPNASLTQPYWLKEKMSTGAYTVNEQSLIGQPDVEPSYTVTFNVAIAGANLSFTKPVKYKFTDPVKGELYQPVFVVPSATVMTAPDVLLLPKNQKIIKQAALQLNANKTLKTVAQIELRAANSSFKQNDTINLSRGISKNYFFNIGNDNIKGERDLLYGFAHFTDNNQPHDAYLAMRGINYNHIPSIKYFFTDAARALNIDLKILGKRIGYIVGAGDKVPEALEQMGYDLIMLSEKEVAKNNLQQFDAIISGVRAYNTNEWLNNYYEKLMKYVENGGNLIVQYNTSNQIGPVRAKISPYNFNISRNRVTDENAAVTFLKPDHQVLHFPNEITQADFKDWVQERSIYHATDVDPKFESILSMADPGETSDNGSLIIARYGKGFFTYTGLVFFRELPAGVPGAYRLIANIIALNKRKEM
jgi:LmbE family N-acetylglucosaminyl deacetylase